MSRLAGEVYLADIFEGGTRPVVLVSREQLNRGSVFLCVPVTSSRVDERRKYGNYVFLPAGAGGIREDRSGSCSSDGRNRFEWPRGARNAGRISGRNRD